MNGFKRSWIGRGNQNQKKNNAGCEAGEKVAEVQAMTRKEEFDGFLSVAIGVLLISLITATLAQGQGKQEAAIIASLNAARAAEGLKPMTVNPDLCEAAATYARQCSRTEWQHNLTPTTYVRENSDYFDGYAGQVGECLAYPLKLDPAWAWLHSDAHRAVIMLPWWKDIGIGTVSGKNSGAVGFVGIRWPKDARAAAQQQCVGGT